MNEFIFPFESLEDLFTSPMGFGVDTASPLQRALCWLLEGKPIPEHLWALPEVSESFGGIKPLNTIDVILLLCGIRCGKTLLCACAAVWAAFNVDVTSSESGIRLRPGETPRVSVVSATTDNAEETLKYVRGAFEESPFLSQYLAVNPMVGDTVTIRHPSGCKIDIKVQAMSSKGVNLVSRWCASVIFDEAPRMASEDEGVINIEEQVKAVRFRLLKGAWIMMLGSPVGAIGYVYTTYENNWKKEDQKCIVVQAYSYRMNPVAWTPEKCAEAEAKDPELYKYEILAQFRDPESQLFSQAVLAQCIRKEPIVIPPQPGKRYMAVMDPAATTNAWTFGIAESPDNRKFTVCYVAQWRGSQDQPLSPKQVLSEIVPVCKSYGVDTLMSDQWAAPAIADLALDQGIGLSPLTVTPQNKTKMYLALLARGEAGDLSLPPDPLVRKDFMNVKKRWTKGSIQIHVVETPDGRHADYAAMLALLCGGYLDAYDISGKDPPKKILTQDDDPYEHLLEEEGWDPMEDDLLPGMEAL